MGTYYAISATKKIKVGSFHWGDTQVVVVSNEATSLATMGDLAQLGNDCHRFITDENAFIAYSEGKNLKVDYAYNARGVLAPFVEAA